jgi:hypothetical protein
LSDGTVSTLFIKRKLFQIKVEANLVIRGTISPCLSIEICEEGRTFFNQSPKARVLSLRDLYGGKICAVMDRQHPRDFFDVMLLLDNEGLTEEIRKAFIVYLISHSRPMSELLNPNFKDIQLLFKTEFQEMTREKITLKQLLDARNKLLKRIHSDLTTNERKFILSVKELHPSWELFGMDGIEMLSAVQWKLQNLGRMDREKYSAVVERLKRCLDL